MTSDRVPIPKRKKISNLEHLSPKICKMFDQFIRTKLFESWPALLAGVVLVGMFWLRTKVKRGERQPASLPDLIPGLWNAYQFVFHNMDFLKYARYRRDVVCGYMVADFYFSDNLKGRNIMKFWLGPRGVYLITGSKNVQYVLRNSGELSSNELSMMAIKQLDSVLPQDINRFKADESGRSRIPSGEVGEEGRIWAPNHQIFSALPTTAVVDLMTNKFIQLFSETIARYQKSNSIRLYSFLRKELATCATIALSGEELLKQNPNFVETMWEFDSYAFPLVFGVPRFLYPKAYAARDAYHEMGDRFLNAAFEKFDWSGPEAETDWEPIFGTRFHRTHSKFLKDRGFALRSRSGMHLGSTWAYVLSCPFLQS